MIKYILLLFLNYHSIKTINNASGEGYVYYNEPTYEVIIKLDHKTYRYNYGSEGTCFYHYDQNDVIIERLCVKTSNGELNGKWITGKMTDFKTNTTYNIEFN